MAGQNDASWSSRPDSEPLLTKEATGSPNDHTHTHTGTEDRDVEESVLCHSTRSHRRKVLILGFLLGVSVVLNLLMATWISVHVLNPLALEQREPATPYAGLRRTVRSAFNTSSQFGLGTLNDRQRAIVWESLDTSAGEISLDKHWAAEKNLPDSTDFWWDQSRSIYLVNGHHNLHCMRKLYRSIVLSRYGIPQMDSWPHLVHCSDHLLQNIICDADDTPLYTVPTRNATTGYGQPRMCRSWDQLQAWAETQTACFSYINETQGVDAVLQRFRYCPEGQPGASYAEKMRHHFGLDKSWDGRPRQDIETIPKYWLDIPEDAVALHSG